MRQVFEHFGVAVAAVSGVLAARNKRIDLFGVIVLALVTALGGGTLRDMILQRGPVFWIVDQSYVITAILTAAFTFYFGRALGSTSRPLIIADALALAFFTILGSIKALSCGTGSVNAVILGVMTGVAGGILRDVLAGQIPLVFTADIYLYATAAFTGAAAFVWAEQRLPGRLPNSIAGFAIILGVRLLAVKRKWALPVFEARR